MALYSSWPLPKVKPIVFPHFIFQVPLSSPGCTLSSLEWILWGLKLIFAEPALTVRSISLSCFIECWQWKVAVLDSSNQKWVPISEEGGGGIHPFHLLCLRYYLLRPSRIFWQHPPRLRAKFSGSGGFESSISSDQASIKSTVCDPGWNTLMDLWIGQLHSRFSSEAGLIDLLTGPGLTTVLPKCAQWIFRRSSSMSSFRP